MAFTYDVTSNIGQMRLLIGDTTNLPTAPADFQDEELQAMLNLTAGMIAAPSSFFGGGSIPQSEILLLACAQAMESLASRTSMGQTGQTKTQGNIKLVGKDQVAAMHAAAQRFRDAVNNLPAWGIIEENTCGFNELVIIRNWVLRTEL
jgi:hypothetical protein